MQCITVITDLRPFGRVVRSEAPEWSTKSPGAILHAEGARRAARRTRAVNRPDSPSPGSLLTGRNFGEVPEWSNGPDSKSGVRVSRTVGSNPTLSARKQKGPLAGPFCVPRRFDLRYLDQFLTRYE